MYIKKNYLKIVKYCMDKTLGDYIKRVQQLQEAEKQLIAEKRNVWNDYNLTKQDIYYVKSEPQSVDSDEKINPHGQH